MHRPLLLLLLLLLMASLGHTAALLPQGPVTTLKRGPGPLVAPSEGRKLRRALKTLLQLNDSTLSSLAAASHSSWQGVDRLSDLLAAPAWSTSSLAAPAPLPTLPQPPVAAAPPVRRRRRASTARRYHPRRYLYFLSAGECPQAPDGRPRMYCPTREADGPWVCVDEEELCDGVDHCPGGEDEEATHCLFHTAMRGHMDILTKYVMLSKLT
ncbi:uncharacterized protein LOC123500704 [Portunus trituberculatus]|uniref:uncharacterized protein LOC123500704 n=1 Tax=Portunus trituberculatus TaxID=210409 RepID=UPI001E1CD9F9|nr:uncharacterized protein LOC123500704 [Portunus trituberculatus]